MSVPQGASVSINSTILTLTTAPVSFVRFSKLPRFVKVILTARKHLGDIETAEFFKDWSPKSIEPHNDKNMEDMERLLTLRWLVVGGFLLLSSLFEVLIGHLLPPPSGWRHQGTWWLRGRGPL